MAETETLTQPTWTLGERLDKAREHAGITRSEMADRLGVSERTIRNYENGTVRVTRLVALAYAAETRVPVEWLMPTDHQPDGPNNGGDLPGSLSGCYGDTLDGVLIKFPSRLDRELQLAA